MYGGFIISIVLLSIGVVALILETIGQLLPTEHILSCVCMFVTWGCLLFGGVSSGLSISMLKSADTEYYAFIETKEMVEYMIDPEQRFANINLTSTVDNMNQWLVNARRSQIRWGNWSRYYHLDLSDLEYITMKVGD